MNHVCKPSLPGRSLRADRVVVAGWGGIGPVRLRRASPSGVPCPTKAGNETRSLFEPSGRSVVVRGNRGQFRAQSNQRLEPSLLCVTSHAGHVSRHLVARFTLGR
jgi:hypothetical protein